MESSENLTKSKEIREKSCELLSKFSMSSGMITQNLARIYYVGGGCDHLTKQLLEELNDTISQYLTILDK